MDYTARLKINSKGFTLVETMVAGAIFSILILGVFYLMIQSKNQYEISQTHIQLIETGNRALNKMIEELRLVAPDKITIKNSGAEIEFDLPDLTNPTDANYEIDWGAAETVEYALGGSEGTNLIRSNLDTSESIVMAQNLTALLFQKNTDSDLITITMSLQKETRKGRLVPNPPLQISGKAWVHNS